MLRTAAGTRMVPSFPSMTAGLCEQTVTVTLGVACRRFRRGGMVFADACPRKAPGSGAAADRGPSSLQLGAGFVPYRDLRGVVIVRRQLAEAVARGGCPRVQDSAPGAESARATTDPALPRVHWTLQTTSAPRSAAISASA